MENMIQLKILFNMVYGLSMFAQVWKLAHFRGRWHVLGKRVRLASFPRVATNFFVNFCQNNQNF